MRVPNTNGFGAKENTISKTAVFFVETAENVVSRVYLLKKNQF